MEPSLALIIAPLGCYSSGRGVGRIQHDTQAYIHASIQVPGLAERKAIIRRILSSRREDKSVRAAVECYLFRNSRVSEWHVLRDEQKSAKVSEFISNVWAAAQGISKLTGKKGV